MLELARFHLPPFRSSTIHHTFALTMSPTPASPPSYEVSVSSPSPSTSSPHAPLLVHVSSARNPPLSKGDSPQGAQLEPPLLAPNGGQIIHYYQQPGRNGMMVSTTLGPETPEMRCLMNGHEARSRFGILGVLATVFFFP